MAIQPIADPPCGDYVVNFGADRPEIRDEAERILRNQGCKQFRHEVLTDGRLIAHGYLRAA
jgi:hypothetical protein